MPSKTEQCFLVCEILAGHEVEGISNAEVAKLLNSSEPTSLRYLQELERIGYTKRHHADTKRWLLTPQIVVISNRVGRAMTEKQLALNEISNRYEVGKN